MRIQGTTPFSSSTTRKAGNLKEKSGAFSSLLGAENAQTEATGTQSTRASSAVLFAQEVDTTDEEAQRDQQAHVYAKGLLDQLDRIRMGLLSGSLSHTQLTSLQKIITHHQQTANDPKLNTILQDIELRVRVELAKLLPPL